MYTVNKGPSKLVAKTRGGLNTFKAMEASTLCDPLGAADRLNPPRPVFQAPRKSHHYGSHHHGSRDQDDQPPATPQHEELVKFVQESWSSLEIPEETPPSTENTTNGHGSSVISCPSPAKNTKTVFYSESPSDALKDFGAFDLESWWGRRLFNNITKSLWELPIYQHKSNCLYLSHCKQLVV